MESHKNWGIFSFIFMGMAVLSAFCKPMRRTHAVWGGLSLLCMLGAVFSGYKMLAPKTSSDENK